MTNAALIRVIIGIFVTLIIVSALIIHAVESNAGAEAQTNYENQVAACEAGNPVREAVLLAVDTAAEVANKGNARYAAAADKITAAPYVDDLTGARNCDEAVKHP